MTLVSVQCPNCGSPVDAPRVGATIGCPSCGSTLSIKQGSSGHPLAQLVNISRDTGFLARQQAVERLKAQLERLEGERAAAGAELSQASVAYSPVPTPWGWIAALALGGLIAGSMGEGGLVVALLLWAGAIGLGIQRSTQNRNAQQAWERRQAEARAALEPRIAQLDGELAACKADLARVEADLDRMAHEF